MARHNKEAQGSDQRGDQYAISYQPDWLRSVKVTRPLESGRQSTKTVFRNTGTREQTPGSRVRTRISSKASKLDFEISLRDPGAVVTRIIVETALPGTGRGAPQPEIILFTLNGRLGGPGSPADAEAE